MKKILLSTILLLSAPIFAQEKQQDIRFGRWVKACWQGAEKNSICELNQDSEDSRGEKARFIFLKDISEDGYQINILLPLPIYLDRGYRILIDGRLFYEGDNSDFLQCRSYNGKYKCETSTIITQKKLNEFKWGKKATVMFFDYDTGETVNVDFSLKGVSEGIDSISKKQ